MSDVDLSRCAVVLGGAHSVWRDLAQIEAVTGPWPGIVVATNETGTIVPRLDHWATLHPEKFRKWEPVRANNGLPRAYTTWSHSRDTGDVQYILTGWSNGSSGLIAVGVALYVGAHHVYLCGIRMDKQRNHFRDEIEWQRAHNYRDGWKQKKERIRGSVFSVSGWTRRELGPPPLLDD